MERVGERSERGDEVTPRRCRPRGQSGVALVTVLAVIAFTLLVIGALFGLLTTSMLATESAERTARENRAADAAIETAINRMREHPCPGVDAPYLTGLVFDQGTASDADDVTVDVTCTPGDAAGGSDQVRIVGSDGYQGPSPWLTDCSASGTPEGCVPWASALGGVPGDLGPISLVHSGHEPLRFASGVSVRHGAATLRTDAGGSPAMRVAGQYHQGAAGLGAVDSGCGALSGDLGGGRGLVRDLDDDPTCSSEQIAALLEEIDGNATGPAAPPPVTSVPGCSGAVVTLAPGTYDSSQTSTLSERLDGSQAACRGKTFHFTPGVYVFTGSELRFGDATSFYVFGEPSGWDTSTGIVGTALAIDPTATLCDTSAPGASVVINGWTRIRHTAGRVAVCPAVPDTVDATPGEPHPGLFQRAVQTGSVQVSSVTPNPPVATSSTGFAGIRNLNTPFSCRIGLPYPQGGDVTSNGLCLPQRRWEFTLATTGEGPVNSLRVIISGRESASSASGDPGGAGDYNDLIRNRVTRFVVFRSGGGELCRTDNSFRSGMPNGDMPSSFDLMASGGTCQDGSFDLSDFDGARVAVVHRVLLEPIPLIYIPTMQLSINRVEVTVNEVVGNGSQVLSSERWANPQNVLTPAGAAQSNMCGDLFCPVPDPDGGMLFVADSRMVHELELGGFSFPDLANPALGDVDPAVVSLRALVTVDPTTASLPSGWPNPLNVQNFVLPHEVELELRPPTGDPCIVSPGGGVNSPQEWSFDLFEGDCTGVVLDNLSALDGVELALRLTTRCLPNWFNNLPSRCLRNIGFYDPEDRSPVWFMRPPDILHVRLAIESDTYTGPPPDSLVTIDATPGASASAFHVYGQARLALTDLDLRWRGSATSTPLFGGHLMVNGLASWMAPGAEMGVVCCSPPDSRTVLLTARIGGQERIVALVDFIDVDDDGVYSLGHRADVLDWRTCSNGSCQDVPGGGAVAPAGLAPD